MIYLVPDFNGSLTPGGDSHWRVVRFSRSGAWMYASAPMVKETARKFMRSLKRRFRLNKADQAPA